MGLLLLSSVICRSDKAVSLVSPMTGQSRVVTQFWLDLITAESVKWRGWFSARSDNLEYLCKQETTWLATAHLSKPIQIFSILLYSIYFILNRPSCHWWRSIDKSCLDHLSSGEHFAGQDISCRRGEQHGQRSLSGLIVLTGHSQEEEIKQIEQEEDIEDSGPGDLLELGANALSGFLGLLGAKIDLLRSLLTNKVISSWRFSSHRDDSSPRIFTRRLARLWRPEWMSPKV